VEAAVGAVLLQRDGALGDRQGEKISVGKQEKKSVNRVFDCRNCQRRETVVKQSRSLGV